MSNVHISDFEWDIQEIDLNAQLLLCRVFVSATISLILNEPVITIGDKF